MAHPHPTTPAEWVQEIELAIGLKRVEHPGRDGHAAGPQGMNFLAQGDRADAGSGLAGFARMFVHRPTRKELY